ncbi:hypothetical protein AWENTII_004373 [Aspergillus wentii]|nr:hypothetical protein MW887_010806 [Aspergillus wentii]
MQTQDDLTAIYATRTSTDKKPNLGPHMCFRHVHIPEKVVPRSQRPKSWNPVKIQRFDNIRNDPLRWTVQVPEDVVPRHSAVFGQVRLGRLHAVQVPQYRFRGLEFKQQAE